jgi:hypothetical protein
MICIAGDYYIMKQYYSIVGDEKYGRWGLLDCYLFFWISISINQYSMDFSWLGGAR